MDALQAILEDIRRANERLAELEAENARDSFMGRRAIAGVEGELEALYARRDYHNGSRRI